MPRPRDSGRNDLFRLIHSLSKSEKRYFKIFVGKSNQSKHLKLFKLILEQEEYNESELKAQLKGDPIINNFHVAKKYLFEQIMDSLILYHKDNNSSLKLKKLLLQIDICNKKGLTKTSFNLLKNAEKIALKHEKFNFLLEISSLKKLNLMDRAHKDYEIDAIQKISSSENIAVDKIQHIQIYKTKIVELFSEYIKWEGIRNPKKSAFFNALAKNKYFNDEKYADSFESKILLFTLKGYYFHELGNYKESISYREKIMTLMESDKIFAKVYSRNYLVAMHNYITDLRMIGDYSEMKFAIEKYKSLPTENFSSEAEQFRRYYIMLSQWMIDTMDFSKLKSSENEFNLKLPIYKSTISESIVKMIKYQFALCNLLAGNTETSINQFMEIIHNEDNKRDKSIVGYCQIWLIIAHFEMGNFSILPYLSRSTNHYFKKNKVLFKIEKRLFDFFSNEKNFENNNYKDSLKKLDEFLANKLKPENDKSKIYSLINRWAKNKITELDK